MKVTSWNLLHGQLLPGAPVEKDGIAEIVRQLRLLPFIDSNAPADSGIGPDVLAVQEVDDQQPRSGGRFQIQELASQLQAPYWGYAPTVIGTPGENWHKPTLAQRNIVHHAADIPQNLSNSQNEIQAHPIKGTINGPSYGIGLISKIPVLKWHRLDISRSPIGLPLAFPGEKGVRLIYVKDEPRVALAAELHNGFTVVVTHLSFVPVMNIIQLWRVQRWLKRLPGTPLLMGDLNLPFGIPERISSWHSLNKQLSYPSWKSKVKFDYILSRTELEAWEVVLPIDEAITVSDHLPISIQLSNRAITEQHNN